MGRYRFSWLIGLGAIALLAVVGVYAYNIGVAHGLAESGRFAVAPGAGVPVGPWWPRPWGFGFFPFFPVFPLLFLLFAFVIARALFWRGAWHGRGYCGGVPPAFDEWHRRAHAQTPPPDAKA